jgi:hypothetical protein
MTKPLGGVHHITMGETLYRFTSHFLCLQFRDAFVTHFYANQFEVAIKGGCEIIIHGIICTLDLHPNWVVLQLNVVNAFNLVLRGVIFQELRVLGGDIIQIIPFVHAFYAFEFPLFYNHHNREVDVVVVIPYAMGLHQGDPLRGALFALAHLKALHSIVNFFPSCLFPSITDDTNIIGPPSIVLSTYEHFQIKLRAIGLSI